MRRAQRQGRHPGGIGAPCLSHPGHVHVFLCAKLAAEPDKVREILADGASRARKKAGEVLQRAQKACGLK